MQAGVNEKQEDILRSLLEVGVNLSAVADRSEMLEMILRQVRRLARAEGGSLYIARGGSLRFVAAQNDRLPPSEVAWGLKDKEMPVSGDSLAGFVASSGRVINIPDAYELSAGTPFRINRAFDAATGYRTRSVLAIPLKCPDGECIGVLELINRLGRNDQVIPFPKDDDDGIIALAAMAAVTIHNSLLQDELKQANMDSIIRLSVAAEFRDDVTGQHVRRISLVSSLIAEGMGMPPEQVELIRYASPMHDIGKIGIPDAILQKPGPLTPEERRAVEKHTIIGGDILKNPTNDILCMARDVAIYHHERWDGQGYPEGLAGCNIPIAARIVCLADVFDALISERCYKEAYSLVKALRIIRREKARQFAPDIVDAFFKSLDDILAPYNLAVMSNSEESEQ